eukprot:1193244-Prorocentrum_minimum.AAC.1
MLTLPEGVDEEDDDGGDTDDDGNHADDVKHPIAHPGGHRAVALRSNNHTTALNIHNITLNVHNVALNVHTIAIRSSEGPTNSIHSVPTGYLRRCFQRGARHGHIWRP